jgi:hypothetical protein
VLRHRISPVLLYASGVDEPVFNQLGFLSSGSTPLRFVSHGSVVNNGLK